MEDCLVAVVSLPAGVFKPYSGVKTSILILDKALARRTDSVAFIKVENDGYDLGDQRRPISDDDLPGATAALRDYLRGIPNGSSNTAEIREAPAEYGDGPRALVVPRDRIAEDGEYNLSGERYRERKDDLVPILSPIRLVSHGHIFDRYAKTAIPSTMNGKTEFTDNFIFKTSLRKRYRGYDVVSETLIDNQRVSSGLKSTKNIFEPNQILYGSVAAFPI